MVLPVLPGLGWTRRRLKAVAEFFFDYYKTPRDSTRDRSGIRSRCAASTSSTQFDAYAGVAKLSRRGHC